MSLPDRTVKRLESMHLNWRATMERAYQSAPRQVHAELVHTGYWLIAAQLKIDYESGRLAER